MERKKLTHLVGLIAIMLLMSGQAFAQNLRVTGKVVDENGAIDWIANPDGIILDEE